MREDGRRPLERRLSIVECVTPVRRLPSLSAMAGCDVFAKQDDQTCALYGGTKPRKLEFILQDALDAGAHTLVTMGGWGSHHVTATALHAGRLGLEVHAVVAPQPRSGEVELTLGRSLAAGAVLHPAGGDMGVALGVWSLMRRLRRLRRQPYLVSLGGSSVAGTLGTVRAALELVEQERAGQAPRGARVVVALGSGSTAAGLALGFVLAGSQRPIQAVRVTSPLVSSRLLLRRLVHAAAARLAQPSQRRRLADAACALIEVDASMLGRGYGWSTPAGDAALQAARADALFVEPTYTAKALAAGLARRQGGAPFLYWHTLAQHPADAAPHGTLPPWYAARC